MDTSSLKPHSFVVTTALIESRTNSSSHCRLIHCSGGSVPRRFSRAIRLPFEADPENVEARFGDGVLQIVIGRREEDKPRRIEIKAA